VLGAYADHVGTHTAFLLVPVLLAGAAVGVVVSGDLRGGWRRVQA
jgi:hypothetical protein